MLIKLNTEMLSIIKNRLHDNSGHLCAVSLTTHDVKTLEHAVYFICNQSKYDCAIRISKWFSTYEELFISIAFVFPRARISEEDCKDKYYNSICFYCSAIHEIEGMLDVQD